MFIEDDLRAARAAEIAHALAHPARLQILESLLEEGVYVMDLTHRLGRRQANISQHLAVLREAGLVRAEREGMAVRYTLQREKVRQMLALLDSLAEGMPLRAVGRRRCRGRRGCR